MEWMTFTKRTEDPKLIYVERLLDEKGIPHVRDGQSAHGPLLKVPEDRLDEAWALLDLEVDMGDDKTMRLDDIPDDDILFTEDTGSWEMIGEKILGTYDDCEITLYREPDGSLLFRWQRFDYSIEPYTSELYRAKSERDAWDEARRLIDEVHKDKEE